MGVSESLLREAFELGSGTRLRGYDETGEVSAYPGSAYALLNPQDPFSDARNGGTAFWKRLDALSLKCSEQIFVSEARTIGRWSGLDSPFCICVLASQDSPLLLAGTNGVNYDLYWEDVDEGLRHAASAGFRLLGVGANWVQVHINQADDEIVRKLEQLSPDSLEGRPMSMARRRFRRRIRETQLAYLWWA